MLACAALIGLSLCVGLSLGKKQIVNVKKNEVALISPTIVLTPKQNIPTGLKTYTSSRFGISFDYPDDWTIKEPTVDVLQVILYPPESDPEIPSSNMHFSINTIPYSPEPTPGKCMSEYVPYYTSTGIVGRKTEDMPPSRLCLPKTGGCSPSAQIQLPIMGNVLEINYCLQDKTRFEEIINTVKIVQ